jgi:hypothetical protein
MNRGRIARLESALLPKPPRILGATVDVRTGELRSVLYDDRGNHPAPPGLTLADLPPDCRIYRYDPSTQCASLYQSTADGRAHVQVMLSVDEDEVCPRFQPTQRGGNQR